MLHFYKRTREILHDNFKSVSPGDGRFSKVKNLVLQTHTKFKFSHWCKQASCARFKEKTTRSASPNWVIYWKTSDAWSATINAGRTCDRFVYGVQPGPASPPIHHHCGIQSKCTSLNEDDAITPESSPKPHDWLIGSRGHLVTSLDVELVPWSELW